MCMPTQPVLALPHGAVRGPARPPWDPLLRNPPPCRIEWTCFLRLKGSRRIFISEGLVRTTVRLLGSFGGWSARCMAWVGRWLITLQEMSILCPSYTLVSGREWRWHFCTKQDIRLTYRNVDLSICIVYINQYMYMYIDMCMFRLFFSRSFCTIISLPAS